MSHALIDRRLHSFLTHPTETRFRSLQRMVMADRDYDPLAQTILQLESRLHAMEAESLLAEIEDLSWIWQLCPRLHFVQARTYEDLGQQDRMATCVATMQNCLRGLLSTGDGSKNAPFAVTFLTDQRDVLRVIGEEFRVQQLVRVNDRCCDVITSHDGCEVWFDVTEIVARLSVPLEVLAHT